MVVQVHGGVTSFAQEHGALIVHGHVNVVGRRALVVDWLRLRAFRNAEGSEVRLRGGVGRAAVLRHVEI